MDNKNTSQGAEVKHLSVKYHRAKRSDIRYIHKYYLHQELKPRIFMADIQALWHSDRGVWVDNIPDAPPSCVMHYDDLGLEKVISGDEVRSVLQAIAAYRQDLGAELTDEEDRAAMNLNSWLTEWEKTLLAECVRVAEEMKLRVQSGDPWLTDYEIDLDVQFYVRDDDHFAEENNPSANDHDVEMDAALLCSTERLFAAPLFGQDVADPEYRGIGGGQDHNDRLCRSNNMIYTAKHCATFHELYDHLHIPMKHMGRIGRVYTDIVVMRQNGISIDLTGEKAVSVQDQPRIREYFPVMGQIIEHG